MKIFVSHSSRWKPLIRDVISHFPPHIRTWVDENDILIGDNLTDSLREGVNTLSDLLLLFIDNHSVHSEWVKKELDWAIDHEEEIGRPFILPVLLEDEAISLLKSDKIKGKKYLKCTDFSKAGVEAFATNLISELFAWLSRDLERTKNSQKQNVSTGLLLLDQADAYLTRIADSIRKVVYPHRKENPLSIRQLYRVLHPQEALDIHTYDQFLMLLGRLRQREYLAGLVCIGESIYLEEEHYAWKTTIYTDIKKRIANEALKYVRSNQRIILDAGSTTLEIAHCLGHGLKMQVWSNMKVITNSITAANHLLTVASELGFEDDNKILQIYIAGGRIRCNTLAIVGDERISSTGELSISNILESMGGADLCFVGTNGIAKDKGFSTHVASETKTKACMLEWSSKKFIVADPSKFNIREDNTFANFDDNISIITVMDKHELVIEDYNSYFANTSTNIILAQ